VWIADTKPYPWKNSPDGSSPNCFKLESGPLGKHIYLTSHGMYIQNAHQIASFTLAALLYFVPITSGTGKD